jgi:hypothetical protein
MRLRNLSQLHACYQLLPIVLSGPVAIAALAYLLPRVPAYVVFGGSMLAFFTANLLLSFQATTDSYWPFTFPGDYAFSSLSVAELFT